MGLRTRLAYAWNAFNHDKDLWLKRPTVVPETGPSSSYRPDRQRRFGGTERSIITSLQTRIAIDVAGVAIKHVKVDKTERYLEDVPSKLNRCLTLEANIDQSGTDFRRDIALTLLEKGVIAVMPVDTDEDPDDTDSYQILTMRVGEIIEWYPRHVKLSVYDDRPNKGARAELLVSKENVAIIENPLYNVMNEPNSTYQRLIRKLNILDAIDDQSGSGKLDIIIQLPYSLRSETKRTQAAQRRADLEEQLNGSKYGVGYIDASEHITQLNRAAENNLLSQIEYLTNMLYQQLGLTPKVFDGTADEAEMLNYFNRTIEPILTAIVENFKRKFLTQTAITQGHSIKYLWDVFKLVPISQIAEIADKLTRNEIASSNEIRGILGWKPSTDPDADKLRNSNMPQQKEVEAPEQPSPTSPDDSTTDGTTSK